MSNLAQSVTFDIPNGVCFSDDGHLYVAERNRVLWFPAAEFFMESPDTVAIPIIDQGGLIPPEEESYNHTARVCAVNKADNKLYVSMGQPFNVAGPDKYPLMIKLVSEELLDLIDSQENLTEKLWQLE